MIENQKPIRVLLLFTIMNRGGAETMVMNYYRHIDRSKIQFDFMVHREQRGVFEDEIESLGGKIYRMPPIYPQNFIRYQRMLKEFFDDHHEYKIIHSHMSELGYFAFKEAKKHNVPVRICHSHNAPDFRHETFIQYLKFLPRYYFIRQMRHLTTDFFVCSHIAGMWHFGEKRQNDFVFMRNAVDLDSLCYKPEEASRMRKELGLSQGQHIICHVGRFNRQKNHDFLIDIFSEIHKKDQSAVLLLAGDGELRAQIEDKVNRLHLQKNIFFLGIRDNINFLLMASDTLLFPSLYEGLSVVLVEAQASGIRCVMTNTLAKETIINKNRVELLSLNQSAEEWANAVLNRQSNYDRSSAVYVLREAGWDVRDNANWLQKYYLDSVNNG
jgi:glycosyltransferase involved in cell wall biosynthesis